MVFISSVVYTGKRKYLCVVTVRLYPIELEIKDTTYTVKSASYLDIHLEIDNEGRLKTKLYNKIDDFSFPIVNFRFLWSNIPAAPAHGVYTSQLIRYSRACISYHDFCDRGLLLTRKLLNQEFQMVKLKSFLRKILRTPSQVDWPLWNNRFTDDIEMFLYVVTTIPFPFHECDLPI